MNWAQALIAAWLFISILVNWFYAGRGRRIEVTPGGALITTLTNGAMILWVLAQ